MTTPDTGESSATISAGGTTARKRRRRKKEERKRKKKKKESTQLSLKPQADTEYAVMQGAGMQKWKRDGRPRVFILVAHLSVSYFPTPPATPGNGCATFRCRLLMMEFQRRTQKAGACWLNRELNRWFTQPGASNRAGGAGRTVGLVRMAASTPGNEEPI